MHLTYTKVICTCALYVVLIRLFKL